MKTVATMLLCLTLAAPALAGVVYDESVSGDLSTLNSAPTALTFTAGGNTIIGSVGPGDPRDYITFAVPDGHVLMGLNLLSYPTANISFAAFNAGTTSYVPSATTNSLFLSGIHVNNTDEGLNLMPFFMNRAVTTNSLSEAQLTPGNYCFVIQQANPVPTPYSLEFVLDGGVPVIGTSWGAIKDLYRTR